jgi:hypothetical protein
MYIKSKTRKHRTKNFKFLKKQKKNSKRNVARGLIGDLDNDLKNTHLCPPNGAKPGKKKETIGEELYTFVGMPFELNSASMGFFMMNFLKSDNKWFKFVIFNNSGVEYIYVISGGKINKHSVCMIMGLLGVTNPDEYPDIKEAVGELLLFKSDNTPEQIASDSGLKTELDRLVSQVDGTVSGYEDIKCMPVIAAGSGTVNDDGSICINNKSGHYKPTPATMSRALEIFTRITGVHVVVTEKVDKELLIEKYGNKHEHYSGICL